MADTITTTASGSQIRPAVGGRATSSVGGFETDANKLPFIREQDIGIYATGMKPNTRLYVFFDGKLMSAFVTPATLSSTTSLAGTLDGPAAQLSDFFTTGARGDNLVSDSNGVVCGVLHIPSNVFFTGDRLVIITDVDSLFNMSSATTTSTFTFHAFNYAITNVTDNGAVVSARPASDSSSFSSSSTTNNFQIDQSTLNIWNTTITNVVAPEPPPPIIPPPETFDPVVVDISMLNIGIDPLAQSFIIGSDGLQGSDGIYLSSVDLYFQTKDEKLGATVEIRTIENGVPTNKVLPFSRVQVAVDQISTGNNASEAVTATRVYFESPVFVSSDFAYALCVIPQGNNPNTRLYTATVGATDLTTGETIVKNWGSGDLFTSTNGSTWVPIPNEFMKFTLNAANFQTANGYVTLTNKDYDFVVTANNNGLFEQGEIVFQLSSNLTFGNSTSNTTYLQVNSQSYTVTLPLNAPPTNSLTQFGPTSAIVVSNGSVYDVLFVNSVSSANTMTVRNLPKFSSTTATVQNTPVARVFVHDPRKADLTLYRSTVSNSAFCFSNNAFLIGITTGANTQIASLQDKVINRFNPYIYGTSVTGTGLNLQVKTTLDTYGNTTFKTFDMNKTGYFVDQSVVVASRTNEILNMSGRKSLTANIALSTYNNLLSPTIDMQSASVIGYRNLINSNTTNENTKNGAAWNKYISKTITLQPGLDSEALYVYLTAYRPLLADIKVYAKFLSAADSDAFDTKDWTELELDGDENTYSDYVNLSDLREFKFKVPSAPPSTSKTGVISTTSGSNTVTGTGTSFTSDIAIGDLLRINSDATGATFNVVRVQSIANNTSLALSSPASFTTAVGTYAKVDTPKTAFLNNQNDDIARYYSSTGVAYDSFISYAIKVVLTSEATYRAPRIHNIRAVAVI